MRALANHLSLSAGNNEETLFVFALLYKKFVDIDLLSLKRVDQTIDYLIIKLRKQRNGFQCLSGE